MYIWKLFKTVMFILGYCAVAEMREIVQSFEDGGMPGTIGRYCG